MNQRQQAVFDQVFEHFLCRQGSERVKLISEQIIKSYYWSELPDLPGKRTQRMTSRLDSDIQAIRILNIFHFYTVNQ